MTIPPAKVQRTDKSLSHRNTLRLPITFCVVEFLDNSDSTMVKRRWEKFGFRDVTPRIGNARSEVATFKKDKYAQQWEDFQEKLGKVYPEWIYISGHHAAQFWASANVDNNGRPYNTNEEYRLEQSEVGFFNEDYHLGRWHWIKQTPPQVITQKPTEIFMSMTNEGGGGLLAFETENVPKFQRSRRNPLLGELRNPFCMGLLLIGCNTLTYGRVRRALTNSFPEAVVIGLVSKNSANAIPLIQRIFKVCNRAWFLDPTRAPGHPSKELDPMELARRINFPVGKRYRQNTVHDLVSVMYEGRYYFPILKSEPKALVIDDFAGLPAGEDWYKLQRISA